MWDRMQLYVRRLRWFISVAIILVVALQASIALAQSECDRSYPSTPTTGKCAKACCGFGTWPLRDCLDGGWLPSRSTHYGSTPSGACGMGAYPNWDATTAPAAYRILGQNAYSNYYAAPEGAYYSQDDGNYFSCGECWELKCADLDNHCPPGKPTITLQIADSCPCSANPKWCCGKDSDCEELQQWGTSNGCPVHCPKVKGPWDDRSIHLDLNDAAYTAAFGPQGMNWGSVNTMIRRVPCKPRGNIFLHFHDSLSPSRNCYVGVTYPNTDCYYFFEVSVVNAAGLGSVTRMDFYTGVKNAAETGLEYRWYENLRHDWNTPMPQERYGMFKSEDGIAFFGPFRFRFFNAYGEWVETGEVTLNELGAAGQYWDTGVQFKLADSYVNEKACAGHKGEQHFSENCSWGVPPPVVVPPPVIPVIPPITPPPVAPPPAVNPVVPSPPPPAPAPPPAAPIVPAPVAPVVPPPAAVPVVVPPPPPPPPPPSFPWAALLPVGLLGAPAAYVVAKKKKKAPPPRQPTPPPPPPPEPIKETVVIEKRKPELNKKVKKWADVDTSKYIWSREGGTARPMPVKWGEKGATEFATHLDAIGHKEVYIEKKVTDKATGRVLTEAEAKEIEAKPDVEYEYQEIVHQPAPQPKWDQTTIDMSSEYKQLAPDNSSSSDGKDYTIETQTIGNTTTSAMATYSAPAFSSAPAYPAAAAPAAAPSAYPPTTAPYQPAAPAAPYYQNYSAPPASFKPGPPPRPMSQESFWTKCFPCFRGMLHR